MWPKNKYKTHASKTYVVFNGRKPGIYSSWVDCHAQVNEFKGTSYQAFHTFEEANEAWTKFCEPGHIHSQPTTDDGSSSSQSTVNNAQEEGLKQFVHHAPQDFIIQYNMQTLLYQVCACRRIQPPMYTFHSSMMVGGQRYYRYYASLASPAVSMGRFAKTEDMAREDVAVLLLRRLLASDGSKIRDYNYYNVELLQAEIENLNLQKFELQMENEMLVEELRLFRGY